MTFTKAFYFSAFAIPYLFIWASSAEKHEHFLHCLSLYSPNATDSISKVVYTPTNSSYSPVLKFSIRNLRFSTAHTPRPQVIITPTHVSHVQASVICSRAHGFQIRTRSGGHDAEGLSYVSDVPFVIVDFVNLRSITINVQRKTAWVQSGATAGELYYSIAQKSSTLGFPAGLCPTIGIGGHLSGGGYGSLMRKYGLAADNVVDARLVDANGKLFDRRLMGEDLFWAIRGGGGGSFGIVVAWKIKLAPVPPTVTVFQLNRTWDQNTAQFLYRWQFIAHQLDENLFIYINLHNDFPTAANSEKKGRRSRRTAGVSISSLFLGRGEELLGIIQKSFPELGLVMEDCNEMSWIESVLTLAASIDDRDSLEDLLNRPPFTNASFKAKLDYVQEPIPETGLEGIREWLTSGEIEAANLYLIPYGGKMSEISESETPFPHRKGTLFHIGYIILWTEQGIDAAKRHINWSREIYKYMTPFVSKSPRGAYTNYRDLDIGRNERFGKPTSYKKASVWGHKYFGENFKRLVQVKTRVDPFNFFRHEQSIPSLGPWWSADDREADL